MSRAGVWVHSIGPSPFGRRAPVGDDGRVSTPPAPRDNRVPAPPDGLDRPGRRSTYGSGSVPNMVRSLVVVLGLVAVLVAIVPRVNNVTQPAVDAVSVAAATARQTGLPLEVPAGLPGGWKATSARYAASTDGLLTWQAGYTTPQGGFVAVKQVRAASPAWLQAATDKGTPQGMTTAAGRTWQRLYAESRNQTSLVEQPASGLTTVVTGTAGMPEILTFVEALRPADPR